MYACKHAADHRSDRELSLDLQQLQSTEQNNCSWCHQLDDAVAS